MGDGVLSKIKKWIVDEEIDENEDDEFEEAYSEVDERDEELSTQFSSVNNTNSKASKILSIHTNSQMKVVILEPKKYDEAAIIADHLKQKKAVVVNLENLEDSDVRKSIFNFMHGAVYMVEGTMQKVSKAIFILAPSNVDIDGNMKKELESKAFFPWQGTK